MIFTRNAKLNVNVGMPAYVVAVNGRRVYLPAGEIPTDILTTEIVSDCLVLGDLDGQAVVAVYRDAESSDQVEPQGWLDLRQLMQCCDASVIEASILGVQRLEFREATRYCSRCASQMEAMSDTGVKCISCGHSTYPHVTPAVLLLIEDENRRTLLAQKDGWGARYSVIAGFVEPSESLEQCCIREALEEVGVQVTDVRYVGSQPWPFPHQLMVAFRARWVSGEIKLDPDELADARWFGVDELPELPPRIALSRILIQHWIDNPAYP